jgi:hypothetical protein
MTDSGFINFPFHQPHILSINNGITYCYLISIDVGDNLPSLNFNIDSTSYTDDVTPKKITDTSKMSLSDAISAMKNVEPLMMDLNIVSAILIGSTDHIFNKKSDINPWNCSFSDLTTSGKDLYYSIKKLHYDKEIKIITITKI